MRDQLVLFTNRKLQTGFRSVPKIGDLEWPWTTQWSSLWAISCRLRSQIYETYWSYR